MGRRDEVDLVRGLMRARERNEIDRREFLTLAAVVSAGAIAAACSGPFGGGTGGSSTGRKQVPLYTTENDPTTLAFFANVIAEFRKQHPGFDVPLTIYDDGTRAQYLQAAFQAGTDVGIFAPPPSLVLQYVKAGFVLPISDLVKTIGVDDFLPGTRTVVKGDDYIIAFQSNSYALWYRKDLFQRAGITPPATYDDLLSAVTALNGKDGVVGIAAGMTSGDPDFTRYMWTPFLYQSGWDWFTHDLQPTFGQPEVLEGVKRYVALMQHTDSSFYNGGYGDVFTGFVSGKAAMAIGPGRIGDNAYAQNPRIAEVAGVVPIPAGPFMTGKFTTGATVGYGIARKSAYPAEAKAFLQLLTTGDNALAFSLSAPGHLLPPLKSVTAQLLNPSNQLVAANALMQKHSEWVQVLAGLVPTALDSNLGMGSVANKAFANKLSNPNPIGSKIWTTPALDATMLQQILIQKQSPEAAWTATANQAKTLANDFLKANPGWKPLE